MVNTHTKQILQLAYTNKTVIPAFNIPYLPMLAPIVQAIENENSFALIQVARLEWVKFKAGGMLEIYKEYRKYGNRNHTRLHLDHIPVIDEDGHRVDFSKKIQNALDIGFESVMVDGSRLSLEDNIRTTSQITALTGPRGIACEAELGAVLGHGSERVYSYREIFNKGIGFTKIEEAIEFVDRTQCDWLSVAIGNIHGSISEATRNQPKPHARLSISHLSKLKEATGIPLVLHGGSGIQQDYVLEAIKNGISKINIGTEIRQEYEKVLRQGKPINDAQKAVYNRVCFLISDFLGIKDNANLFR